MKTKTIFKTLALAMMMPAMLLTTACSSDDDAIVNNPENNNQKGYAIPVTVNVTRQGDATTRAEYNESTKVWRHIQRHHLYRESVFRHCRCTSHFCLYSHSHPAACRLRVHRIPVRER